MPKTKFVIPSQEEMVQVLGGLDRWSHQCHAASIHLVKSDLFPEGSARVARGFADGVFGQHSWVVIGRDCYDDKAKIVDPTLWSYNPEVKGIYVGNQQTHEHVPHGGVGSIWTWGKPEPSTTDYIPINREGLSASVCLFLDLLEPLDRRGWMQLLSYCPVDGWPAKDIYEAVDRTPGIAGIIPIDRVGMVTDKNPHGLYLKGTPGVDMTTQDAML